MLKCTIKWIKKLDKVTVVLQIFHNIFLCYYTQGGIGSKWGLGGAKPFRGTFAQAPLHRHLCTGTFAHRKGNLKIENICHPNSFD